MELENWKRDGKTLKNLKSLAVWSTESDIVFVYDSIFSDPVLYCEAGMRYHINKQRGYVYLDEETPGITDSITERLKADHVVQAAEREAVHVKEMVGDLATRQGRKRFLDLILREIADKDITAVPKHLGAHLLSRAFMASRENQKKDTTMYIGLPLQWPVLELHSVRGDLLGSGAKETMQTKRLSCKTLSGDITCKGLQVEHLELVTTGGSLSSIETISKDQKMSALSGEILLEQALAKRLELRPLRGQAQVKNCQVRICNCEAKAGELLFTKSTFRELHMKIAAGSLKTELVKAKQIQIDSTLGDMDLEFSGDIDAKLSSSAGDIRIRLENGYRGFTAKVEDLRETNKILKTGLHYGRIAKDYTGDCKIACNEKTSKLHIASKGSRVEILGSAKKEPQS